MGKKGLTLVMNPYINSTWEKRMIIITSATKGSIKEVGVLLLTFKGKALGGTT